MRGEIVESSVDCNNLLLCDYEGCDGIGGKEKNADYCTKAMALSILYGKTFARKLDMTASKWFCPLHRQKNADEKILHVKYTQSKFGDPSYLKLKDGEGWTKCTDTEYMQYAISKQGDGFTKSQFGIPVKIMIDSIEDKRLSLNYLRSYNYTTPTSLGSDDGIPPIIRKKYQYLKSNNIMDQKQFENFLPTSTYEIGSKYCKSIRDDGIRGGKGEEKGLSYLAHTLDISKHCKRKKVFLDTGTYGQYALHVV